MGDVLNDEGDQEADDEPVKKGMQESDANEGDDQGEDEGNAPAEEGGEEQEGDEHAARGEEIAAIICPNADDEVGKHGFFENKSKEGDEKDDSHYIQIIHNGGSSFTWKSKAGKEW